MRSKEGHFLWCWRCGALGVWHLTWTVLTERSHTQRPSPPLPTIQLPKTPYNPLQHPLLQHNTMPPPIYPHTPQYSTPHPPPARDLFPGRWVPSIQRSVYFAYSQKCQHLASFLFFRCPGNMSPLVLFLLIKKNFDPLHRHHLWGLSASHLARCPPLVARDVNPWATLLSITVLTIFII